MDKHTSKIWNVVNELSQLDMEFAKLKCFTRDIDERVNNIELTVNDRLTGNEKTYILSDCTDTTAYNGAMSDYIYKIADVVKQCEKILEAEVKRVLEEQKTEEPTV